MKKRIASMFLALVLVLSVLPVGAIQTVAAAATSGSCGKNAKWAFDSATGTLSVTGSGAMSDYEDNRPWKEYLTKIKKVSIGEGITRVGDFAFTICTSLITVILPKTLKEIGYCAFNDCKNLATLTLPASLKISCLSL